TRTQHVDCGIAITQQHGWPLIENVTHEADEQRQIERHLDWLLRPSSDGGCGYDFLSTASGFSEFNHPDCTQMLRWMNMTTAYTAKLGKVCLQTARAHRTRAPHTLT